MPPRRAVGVTLQDLEEQFEQMRVLFDGVNESIRELREQLVDMFNFLQEHYGGQPQPQERPQVVPSAMQIRRPNNSYGKTGFFEAFLIPHLPQLADQHEEIHRAVSEAALISINQFRNNHSDVEQLNWNVLSNDYKRQTAEDTLNAALAQFEALAIIRRCVDFWPCLQIIKPKWSQE